VKFKRDTLLQFFELARPAIVGMEACPGSQWLARKISALGHRVKIVPAQFARPYVKSNKNDTIDAAAIAEAITRPTMRFVEIKSPDQVDLQALHRIRDQMMGTRSRLVCQMRAYCLEYGAAIRQGVGLFKRDLPRILSDEANDLTSRMRRLLAELFDDLKRLEERIAGVAKEIAQAVEQDEIASRLMSIPGIGPLSASALRASAGDGKQFPKARDLAAWLGLVPRQHSTGGKQTLLGISKRGNSYVRRLLIHGARSCAMRLDCTRDRWGQWVGELKKRMHINKVVVALAAKIALVAWVIMNKPGSLYEPSDLALV
jgi:transposase